MKTILVLLVIALTGCASSGDYKQYVAAQSAANQLATESQKPLVRLTAQPGQAITGLSSLEVYMPVAAQTVQQARPNEWVGILGQGISVLGAVAGLKVSGDAAIGLADSVGKYATQGYANIQAPAANVSNVNIDKSNHSVTTGATSSIVGSYNPVSDSSTHSTPTSTVTGSYNPATSTSATNTTTTNPLADPIQ